MKIVFQDPKTGFIYKDVGDKKNYAIFHKDEGDKQLGWIDKPNVQHMIDKVEAAFAAVASIYAVDTAAEKGAPK